MASLPLPLSELPGLAPLLNGNLWQRWADEGKVFPVAELRRAVRYVRLKPATSCRLAVFRDQDPRGSNGPPIAMLVYLFPSEKRAREFYVKRTEGKIWGKPAAYTPFVDDRRAIVALPFPNDREIPGLRHVYRHHRLKEIVLGFRPELCPPGWRISKRESRLRLIRYKTGRRAVLHYAPVAKDPVDGERRRFTFHLKVEAREVFSAQRETAIGRLADALEPSGIRIPRALGADEERLLTVRPWVPGVDLTGRMSDHDGVASAARALAALHGAAEAVVVSPVDDPGSTAARETEALEALLPEESTRIRRIGRSVAERVSHLAANDPVLLHGDFHPAQVLFDGDQTTLIDLDRLGMGHPVLDLGSFLAHAVELGATVDQRQAFVDAYRAYAPHKIDSADLNAGYCLGLLRRCSRPFRDLLLSWPQLTLKRIDRLEQALEGCE